MKYYLGIDLGGTNIVAGVVDETYKIITTSTTKTNTPRPARDIVDDMIKVANDAVKQANLTFDQIEWLGVGCPGSVIKDTGVIAYSNNLDFHDVPMGDWLHEAFNCPVFLENDANAAAFGEYLAGSAAEAKISVMITLGTGVGGGVVIDDKIFTGFNFAGAELGHIVIERDGRPCTCGRKGCFEAYSSATGLISMTKEAMEADKSSIMWDIVKENNGKVNGKTSFDAMRKGDKAGADVVTEYVKYLACGITNIINIFQPEVLTIGGGLCKEKDYLIKPLKEEVAKEVYTRDGDKNTKIIVATLGSDAGLIGAAMLGKSQ